MLKRVKEISDDYANKKEWLLYLPLLTLALYIFIDILIIGPDHTPFAPVHLLQKALFFVHETAHLAFTWAPGIIRFSSGSLAELLVAGLLVWLAFKGKHLFLGIYTLLLMMLVANGAGAYMADANDKYLEVVNPFVSGDVRVVHDWNIVFGDLKILTYAQRIGDTVRITGVIAGTFGLIFGVFLLFRMGITNKSSNLPVEEEELVKQWSKSVHTDTAQEQANKKKT